LVAYLDAPERHLALQALAIGVVVWIFVYLLRLLVHDLFHAIVSLVDRGPTPLLILLPMVAGILLAATVIWYRHSYIHYRTANGKVHRLVDAEGDGLERAIALYYASEPSLEQALLGSEGVDVRWEKPTLSLAIRKWLATLLTLGSGSSGGLEGSVALIGESVAASMFKPRPVMLKGIRRTLWEWWRVTDSDELQILQICGMAAAFSTLLGAPFAAAFFAIEVVYRRRPVLDKLVYAVIASLAAWFLSHWMQPQHTTLFTLPVVQPAPLEVRYYLWLLVAFLAVIVVTRLFAATRGWISRESHARVQNIWLRQALGATATGIVALTAAWISGAHYELVMSTGQAIVEEALAGNLLLPALIAALLGKLLATSFTVGTGGSAGLLIPAIFMGAMCGAIVANVAGYAPLQFMAPAIAATLVAMINVPLAAILLTLELFGTSYILPSALALVVIMLLAQEINIYRTQREVQRSRELLPGYDVRRVVVPPLWDGKTLNQVQLRARYEINVIGQVIDEEREARVRPAISSMQPLHTGDILLMLGRSTDFAHLAEEFEGAAHTESIATESRTLGSTTPGSILADADPAIDSGLTDK